MKTLFKNYTFYFWLFAVISILLSFYLYHKYSYTNHRLNQVEGILQLQKSIMRPEDVTSSEAAIKIDSLSRLLEVQELKEEYYLNQLNVLSDWFIFYVTGLIALIGLAGFSYFKKIEHEVHKQKEINQQQFKAHAERFMGVESDLFLSASLVFSMTGDMYKENQNWQKAFAAYIPSLVLYSNAIHRRGLTKEAETYIKNQINQLNKLLGHIDKLPLNKTQIKELNQQFSAITYNIDDEDVKDMMLDLRGKTKTKIKGID